MWIRGVALEQYWNALQRNYSAKRAFSTRVRHSTAWRTLSYLQAPGRDVYLLGTAHISQRSADEVRRLARSVQPGIIFAELCEQRARRLRGEHVEDDSDRFATSCKKIISGDLSLADALFKIVARSLQNRSAGTVGLQPGAELLAALEMADELGAELVLGDRDVEETTKRLREAVWEELGAVMAIQPGPDLAAALSGGGGLSDTVERLKTREVLSDVRNVLAKQAPRTAGVIMFERDEFMASRLIDLSATGKRILAVVGAAHMQGIEERWLERVGSAS